MKNIRVFLIVIAQVSSLLFWADAGNCSYYDGYFGYDSSSESPIISLNVNEQDATNVSFRIAAREGRVADLMDLLKQGAQVNSRDDDHNTALMNGSMYCKPRIVEALLKAGAKVNDQNIHGETALMLAVQQSCLGAVSLLIRVPGINLVLKNHAGQNAQDLAKSLSTDVVDGPPVMILRLIAAKPGDYRAVKRVRHRKKPGHPALGGALGSL